ncbi:hypothetical protein HYH02_007937 [Chlamydomonas schloesseri]|uniref:Uncharacterized protein n=1 Tax=Chlamydomonas schloesseri TaxID=2026947 RepID=A0A835WHQ2_9CHLO|nr:hypothetical protein HYH02_007937 [Chlamydomonas schloesseri]|eukprot:KAG2447195.1 hypothetical protein HYH02_007937 [Chlamydomonas schloesseri]
MPSPPPSPPPMFCPRLPPYPGLASVQVLPCDAEYPLPDVCGLGILNGTRITFGPGDVLAIEYANLNSSRAALSRLVLSAERMAFSSSWAREDWAAPAAMVLIASGLCAGPGMAALSTCLHNLYHGVPTYRACPGCFGLGMVRELGVPAEATGVWDGEAARAGDTSFFRSQLPLDAPSLFYFVASVSSHIVDVNYARVARLLYLPGTDAAFMPPSNSSFLNVTRVSNTTGNNTSGTGTGGGGGGASANATVALADGGRGSGSGSGGVNGSNLTIPVSAELVAPSPHPPANSKLTSGAAVPRRGRGLGLVAVAAFTAALWYSSALV